MSLRQPIDELHGTTLHPSYYRDDKIAEAEVALLRRSWLGVGRSDLVTVENNVRTLEIAGTPLIVTLDPDGALHLLGNTCRHRSARLLDGAASCRTIQCPFHGWTYRTDGSLLAAPKMSELPDFAVEDHGLVQYRIEERLGFLFVCLDPTAPGLDDVIGDFVDVHAPWPLDSLATVRRRELVVGCNWKAFLDVFNDYYHLPYVHRDSLGDMYARPDACDSTTGAFTTQFGTTAGTGALLKDEQSQALPTMSGIGVSAADGVRYSWVFPSMTFAAGADALWMYEAYPLGANQCRVVQTCCMPPDTVADPANREKIDAYLRRLDAALEEDIEALTNQHRGQMSPDAQPGPLQPRLEPSVAAFATWYRQEMGLRSS